MYIEDTGIAIVEQRLVRCGSRWSPQHNRWICPAHYGFAYSLAVDIAPDGSAVLRCANGCATWRILDALGLSYSDLKPSVPYQEEVVA